MKLFLKIKEKVIILLSTYNAEKYLREQLDSLLAQTCQPDEILIRDDGSKDGTIEILEEYSKKAENVVFVSDNIYCDAAFYDEWTEAFRKGLAEVDSRLAAECDIVAEFCCGQIIYYKGAGIL